MKKYSRVTLALAILLLSLTISCAQEGNKESSENKKPSDTETVVTKNQKKSTTLVTMYELGSKSCIPCKAMKTVMDSLEVRYPKDLEVIFYDVWTPEGKPYGRKFGIRSIPTQVFHDKSGNEIFRHEGFFPLEKIVALLKKSGVSQ